MLDLQVETGGIVIALLEVEPDEVSRYGIIAAESTDDPLDHGRLHRVTQLVEKPQPGSAPSNLAIIGRYVLTPKIFDKLEQTPRGSGGEIQLTDAIQALMEEQQVFGYAFEGTRYDAGTTMGWLKASVELALQKPELGAEFRAYLQDLQL
jgi:UTP--glucose-1-phosphate uridylyltransferase